MTKEEAVELLDRLVLDKTGNRLTDVQRLIFCDCWLPSRNSYEEIANTHGYSATYLKQDVGPKLWKLISQVCGEKVKKTNFKAILERQLGKIETEIVHSPEIVTELASDDKYLPKQQIDSQLIFDRFINWGEAPDISVFYGRTKELATLEQWLLEDRCRLVSILGMGGIGKTHLAVKLAHNVREQFDYIYWKSLTHAPSLQQVLLDLLQFLNQGNSNDLPTSIDEQISQLIIYLRHKRCLIVLDNLEAVLDSGNTIDRYPSKDNEYQRFFRLIGECNHQSCLLLTSREKPQEISLMQGKTLPVRCWQLSGLSVSAGKQLLSLKGCSWQSEVDCSFLIEKYSGNPLALKMVCAVIQELFAGDIHSFIRQKTLVFSEIFYLLEQQFERLSDAGKVFLYWLAIAQEPISTLELQQDVFPQISNKKLIETLQILVQHSLIEQKNHKFSLQPVVQEYILEKIIDSVCQEIVTEDLKLLRTHALLKAQDKEYIKKEQLKFIIKPIINRCFKFLGDAEKIKEKFRQILVKLQNKDALEVGYASGNILNLLCQLNPDLDQADFSNLIIWQADLQNIDLHNVNFTGSDLSKSVFAEQLTNILSVTFSPNGQLLATGDSNGEIRLWSIAERKLLKTYREHAGWIFALAFSPDGTILASGSSDRSVKLWDIDTDLCFKTLSEHNQRVRCVEFHPQGKILASSSSDNTIKLWDLATGKCLQTLAEHSSYVWSLAFSEDGKMLASGSEDRTIKLWDVMTGKCLATLKGHTGWVRSVAFCRNSANRSLYSTRNILASGGGDGALKIWDVSTGQCLKTLTGHKQRVRSVTFSPDGNKLASGSGDHTIRLWDYEQGQCTKTLHGHSSRLGAIAFSPDGNILASGGEDRAIKLWDVNSSECLKTWQGYASWIQSVAFSPDGSMLASGSENCKIELWHLDTTQDDRSNSRSQNHKDVLLGHTGWVCAVDFSPDGNLLVSASSDYSIKLWDVKTKQCIKTLQGHTRWIRTVAFSPDGQQLVSGSGDYTIKLWDVATGNCLKTWQGHTGWIWSVVFSPDGTTIASGSEDKTIRLWDLQTGKLKIILDKHKSWVQSVIFSPDGQTLASSSCDGTINLWSVATGKCLKTFRGHSSWVQSVAFSPDGKNLASGSCDWTVKIWEIDTGQCRKTLKEHNSWVWSVVFSPDGKTIASGSQDETIKLWDRDTGKCRTTLRNKRPLEGMQIQGVRGLTTAQISTLKALGALEQ